MSQIKVIQARRTRRKYRVRNKITGTAERPRLSVYRSSKHIYAQLIDDHSGKTLAAASSCGKEVEKDLPYGGNTKAATIVGKKLAEAAKAKGITVAAFDRGHYRFHGRVKALALAATDAGLKCCAPEAPKPPPEPKAEAKPKGEPKPKGEGKPKGEKKPKPEAAQA
jgi:large subunit ribosomal protein L18